MKRLLLGSLLVICLGLAIHPSIDIALKAILVALFIVVLPDYVRASDD